MSNELAVRPTSIDGLFEVDLVLHGDERGWFKENWQAQKLEALGLPEFHPVQNNFSFNAEKGVLRGIHAEPWDKFISLANGRAFSAIVDLRQGEGFGRVETFELTPAKAIFVPRGCGNSFQTVEENVVYTYLVNAHWSPEADYVNVNPLDEDLAIKWPIPPGESIISDKDRAQPRFRDLGQRG
jgi:dTDP-4-dehydrorhamnose 3,5-epimerase